MAVGLGGLSAVEPGFDVVDLAFGGGEVAGGVGAGLVVDEDGVAGVAGVEACFAAHVDGDPGVVEDDAADFAE